MSNTRLATKPVLPVPIIHVHYCPCISLHNLGMQERRRPGRLGETHAGAMTLTSWKIQGNSISVYKGQPTHWAG